MMKKILTNIFLSFIKDGFQYFKLKYGDRKNINFFNETFSVEIP